VADQPQREDACAHFQRLLKKDADETKPMIEASRRAMDESRELLARVAKDHPDIP
jgi:hypothetical protein